ncbi:MAG: hypothetical protein DCF20_06175 [Pseudanabaena sp.]|nr:MAG: hypothetical protein DCF20_06175 [Pseudanabaena sp.]
MKRKHNQHSAAIFLVSAIVGIGWALPLLAQLGDGDDDAINPRPAPGVTRPAFFQDSPQAIPLGVFRRQPSQTFQPQIEFNFDPNAWQTFSSKSGGFVIMMPPGIMFDETETLKTAIGDLQFRVLSKHDGNSRFLVAYSDRLAPSQIKSPKAILTAIAERVNPTNLFRLTANRPINIDNFLGRELMFSTAKESIVMRAYLVGDRVYIIGANRLTKSAIANVNEKFFKSFRLLELPAANAPKS